ncbi:MAG: GTPase Era [Spirochaetaceae bacterium]|nr:GTPase Era [Spirochaetaceae bacterium]
MKCGFTAIIGRPSAGKSTLLNALCGEKVAITSSIPQTTRNAIRGIINREAGQIIFLDTPGYHESDKKLNIYLKDVVHRSLEDADVVLYVVDATRSPGREEKAIMDLLAKSGKPVIAVINKTDLESPLLSEIRGLVQVNISPKALINTSAVKGTNLEKLVLAVMDECPEGELHYPTDFYTDQNPEFRISEIIREQAISRSEQEVPHALYVEIADMEFEEERTSWKIDAEIPADTGKPAPAEKSTDLPPGAPEGFFEESTEDKPVGGDSPLPEKRKKLWVRAFLVVERESQVGILVGHKGAKIKSIRIGALREMKKIFNWKISLDLRVKVNPKWRKKDPLLKQMLGSGE